MKNKCNSQNCSSCIVYKQGPIGPTGATGLRGIPGVPGTGIIFSGTFNGVWSGAWGESTYFRETSYFVFYGYCIMTFSAVIEDTDAPASNSITYSGVVPEYVRPIEDMHFPSISISFSDIFYSFLSIDMNGNISIAENASFAGTSRGFSGITIMYQIAPL